MYSVNFTFRKLLENYTLYIWSDSKYAEVARGKQNVFLQIDGRQSGVI